MALYKELSYDTEDDINIESVKGIQFSVLGPEEILKRSVCEINKTDTYSGNRPVPNGLFDIRMGALEANRLCGTCGQKVTTCPNHMGHIKLEVPVYNDMFFDTVKRLLKCVCFYCSKLIVSPNTPKENLKDEIAKIMTIKNNHKRFEAYLKMLSTNSSKLKLCGDDGCVGCRRRLHTNVVKSGVTKLALEWKQTANSQSESLILLPEDVLRVFKKITDSDMEIIGFNPVWSRPEWLICTVLPVPPPAVRPSIIEESGQRREDDLTHKLCDIVKFNNMIKDKKARGASPEVIEKPILLLQYHVFTFIDNQIPGLPPAEQRNGRRLKSIADRMKKKDGRIRGNLNAKRVDQSARSVITPDPYISIDELGVPIKVAMNLTFPETVNKYNIEYLKNLVKEGPERWPGAKYIRKASGSKNTINLKYGNRNDFANHLQYGDIVYRFLQDDDYVLFNRQPSLHKMSMMCHKAKVMPYKTFRLNVLDTPPYNADFDGDEMNLHFPQSVQTMCEIKDLAGITSMIISSKNSKPIIEIVQDTLVGSYRLSNKEEIDDKTVANLQMVNSYFNGVIKRQPTYTGYDVFSMILPPSLFVNVFGKGKNEVQINNSKFSMGKLDKNVFHSQSYGLIPVIFQDYGQQEARRFMDNTQRLICRWLMTDGFSVGISDLVIKDDIKQQIKELIRNMKQEAFDKLDNVRRGKLQNNSILSNEAFVERDIINILNNTNSKVSEICLSIIDEKTNRMINMVKSGSKGKENNVAQMIGCVGQQNVEGKRIAYGFTGRTLPHYTKYDDGPEARGFVENSFINGLTPQEVFFHAMGGREGLIDTAVKTSDTGYIQRRLVKSMEDAKITYDFTVKNANGSIIQFIYGEDGMDGTKIEIQKLPYIDMNPLQLASEYLLSKQDVLSAFMLSMAVSKSNKNIQRCEEHFRDIVEDRLFLIKNVFKNERDNEISFPVPFSRIFHTAQKRLEAVGIKKRKTDLDAGYILDKIEELIAMFDFKHHNIKHSFINILLRINLNPKQILIKYAFTKEIFDWIIDRIITYFKESIAHPGEMVGIVAAQTIGEMGTQMTLDSFHVSGTDAAVKATSGVPRLKEILSVSKNIKTPTMSIYLRDDIATVYNDSDDQDAKNNAMHVKTSLEIVKLCDILEKTELFWDDGSLT
eukprot:751125-Hanusia_phi.AAC.1